MQAERKYIEHKNYAGVSEALFMPCLFASDTFFYTMFFYYLSKKLNLNELNRKP